MNKDFEDFLSHERNYQRYLDGEITHRQLHKEVLLTANSEDIPPWADFIIGLFLTIITLCLAGMFALGVRAAILFLILGA